MSRILKVAIGVVAAVLVVAGAAVVYRETDLMTGSLVVLAGLMIAALLARRVAEREERAGMADWEDETQASADAADDLFGEWALSSPRDERTRPTAPPTPADPSTTDAPDWAISPAAGNVPPSSTVPSPPAEPERFDASPSPETAPTPEPAAPFASSAAIDDQALAGRPASDDQALVASLFAGDPPPAPFEPLADDPDPFGLGDLTPARPTPAFVGAAAPTEHRSPIDWTGQGGRVDERVRTSDDILRVSEVTALPSAVETGGSELARLLSKVEARLREYD